MCLGGIRRDRSGSYAVLTPDGCLYGLVDAVAQCQGQLVDGVTHGRRFHVRGGSLMDGIDPYGNPSTHRRRSIGALSGQYSAACLILTQRAGLRLICSFGGAAGNRTGLKNRLELG
jgi:hypothetical protein